MAAESRYIEIPGWERFQHYTNRDPVWIKNYTRLTHDDAYGSLPLATRGVLHGLWLLYASTGRVLSESVAKVALVGNESDAKYWRVHIERLNHAGFVKLFASKTLARRYQDASQKRRVREDSPLPPQSGGIENSSRAKGTNPRAVAKQEQAKRRAAFVCPDCGIQTKGPQALREHLELVHGGHVNDAGKVEAARELRDMLMRKLPAP